MNQDWSSSENRNSREFLSGLILVQPGWREAGEFQAAFTFVKDGDATVLEESQGGVHGIPFFEKATVCP